MKSGRPFAVFDIDGTVIRWQLYHAVVGQLARDGHIPAEAAEQIRQARTTWKNRDDSESFKAYESVLVSAYFDVLTGMLCEDHAAAIEHVFETYKNQVYTYTRDMIRQLKTDGYCLLAISGSQQEIVDKMAAHYGFDAAVGAHFEQKNGVFTGENTTTVHGKGTVLQRLVEEQGLDYTGSIGIGDSESDISMLRLVEQPIAFNPSRGLFQEASQAGWKVVIERKNMVYELAKPKAGTDGPYLLEKTNAG
jgi:HAD superfamily hydrolase (TIGR01490 family)